MKKRAKFLKLKSKKRAKSAVDETIADAFSTLESKDVAALFWTSYVASQKGKLSSLEAKAPEKDRFIALHPKVKGGSVSPYDVVKRVLPKWRSSMNQMRHSRVAGSPVVLFVCSSGMPTLVGAVYLC